MTSRPLKRANTLDRSISPPTAKRKVTTSTATSKAVANFFTPQSQKQPERVTFHVLHNTLLVARHEGATAAPRPRPIKVAAFDFDDTLIKTKSGNVFARGAEDWQWWSPAVPGTLKRLSEDGHAIVIVSNQSGVKLKGEKGIDRKSLSNFKAKVAAVLQALDLPITMYAATEKDLFRKPRTGMWEQMLKDYGLLDDQDAIDLKSCVFVGDAAGREEDKASKKRKDHSCSDRDLATNLGIDFRTPEEYFLGEEPKPFQRSFDPKPYVATSTTLDSQTDANPIVFARRHDRELVLFCGSPGAGKSTFYWQNLQPLGYERVNQDILKTRDKCVRVATDFLSADNRSVVVDNTNADLETRAVWLALAQKLQVPIRLVHFTAPARLCEHNDTVRALSNGLMNPEKRTMLPRQAFTGFMGRYREPTLDEGFEDITRVDFVFRGTDEEKALWGRYWV